MRMTVPIKDIDVSGPEFFRISVDLLAGDGVKGQMV